MKPTLESSTQEEAKAGEIFAKALPGVHVTLSSDIGRIGLLERENAAIMNACLRDLAIAATISGARKASRTRSLRSGARVGRYGREPGEG